jgi:hypothetical protein
LSAPDVSAPFASYSSVGTLEPGTGTLLVAGLAGLGWRLRCRGFESERCHDVTGKVH